MNGQKNMDIKVRTRVHPQETDVTQILLPLWNAIRVQCVH